MSTMILCGPDMQTRSIINTLQIAIDSNDSCATSATSTVIQLNLRSRTSTPSPRSSIVGLPRVHVVYDNGAYAMFGTERYCVFRPFRTRLTRIASSSTNTPPSMPMMMYTFRWRASVSSEVLNSEDAPARSALRWAAGVAVPEAVAEADTLVTGVAVPVAEADTLVMEWVALAETDTLVME